MPLTILLSLIAALVITVLGVLPGCATAPRIAEPEFEWPLPDRWSVPGIVADSLWWEGFATEPLRALVAEALERNYDLREAAGRLNAAAAQARLAGAPKWPQVGASGSGSRRRQSFIGFPIPGAASQVLSTTTNNYGVSLNVSWEVDIWGKLRAGEAAALADFMRAEANFRGANLSLVAQTARAYFAVVEADRQLQLATSNLEIQDLNLRQIRLRYDEGLRPALDVHLARSNQAASEAVLEGRRRRLDLVTRQLEILVGRYPAAQLQTHGELTPVEGPVPAGLPAGLLARRPDLVAAERQVAAAAARVSEARRALYPRLSLTGSGGRASAELGDLLDGDFGVWTMAANLSQPLLQGGRLRAGVELAQSQHQQAEALFAASLLRALGEVEAGLAADLYLAGQERALRRAAEEAIAARRLARERYVQGLTDVLTLLDAQRRAHEAESQMLDVRRQQIDNRIDLHLALGGDFNWHSAGSVAGAR